MCQPANAIKRLLLLKLLKKMAKSQYLSYKKIYCARMHLTWYKNGQKVDRDGCKMDQSWSCECHTMLRKLRKISSDN